MNPGIHSLQKHEPSVGGRGNGMGGSSLEATFFFFFGHVHTRKGGGFRTSDLRFRRRSLQLIELLFGGDLGCYQRPPIE
jgi:hypothetical protein